MGPADLPWRPHIEKRPFGRFFFVVLTRGPKALGLVEPLHYPGAQKKNPMTDPLEQSSLIYHSLVPAGKLTVSATKPSATVKDIFNMSAIAVSDAWRKLNV
jgi:hypothetical protein